MEGERVTQPYLTIDTKGMWVHATDLPNHFLEGVDLKKKYKTEKFQQPQPKGVEEERKDRTTSKSIEGANSIPGKKRLKEKRETPY